MLNCEPAQSEDGPYIEEHIFLPYCGGEEVWRYTVEGEEIRAVQQGTQRGASWSLQKYLWERLRLDRVCARYGKAYESWERDNNQVPYLPTMVEGDDGDQATKWDRSDAFMDHFLGNCQSGLHLLMAEYGMGKTSFCYGLRKHIAKSENGEAPKFQKQFLDGQAAFPFVFNLNEYRNQAFDQFIQNKLFEDYGISLRFRTFEQLCRTGVFTVVLDAWDQMHGTPRREQVIHDIAQFASLWNNRGRVLITCRRSFYQTQLHAQGGGQFGRASLEQATLYALHGFRKQDAERYFDRIYQHSPSSLLRPAAWFESAWLLNEEFFIRPLNVQLLAKYYDIFRQEYDPETTIFDIGDLLGIVLTRWEKRAQYNDELDWPPLEVLKQLTALTLQSGLNRGIRIGYLAEKLAEAAKRKPTDGQHSVVRLHTLLEEFEFVSIRSEKTDLENDTVEFRLATYQEYLWANLVIRELRQKKICGSNTLVNQFLLNPEARAWAAKALQGEQSDFLEAQLRMLAYRNFADVGYSGGNALTILRDLNRVTFYRQQFQSVRLTNRPLQGADLHGMDLSGMSFRNSNLREANLSYTKLIKTDFSNTDLTDVRWSDYGALRGCAFLMTEAGDRSSISVVSGTKSGGVLTFDATTRDQRFTNLAEDEIQDITADRAGVYTAGRDGYVGYLDPKGNMRNAFISAGALQSIAFGSSGTIYFGVEQEGLIRYDWKRGSRQPIDVRWLNGADKKVPTAFDIRYCESAGEKFIAYTSDDHKTLTLLSLTGPNQAEEIGTGRLRMKELRFSDICFAGDYLVYAIPGRGIYARPISNYFEDLDENVLLSDASQLCVLKEKAAVELAWATKSSQLYAVVKGKERVGSLLRLSFLNLDGPGETAHQDVTEVKLDWEFDHHNYVVCGSQISGFSVYDDGSYAALAGERLAVFTWENDCYGLVQAPVESKILCDGADFSKCDGLSQASLEEFRKRGAKV